MLLLSDKNRLELPSMLKLNQKEVSLEALMLLKKKKIKRQRQLIR
jgi:hypothetical protein